MIRSVEVLLSALLEKLPHLKIHLLEKNQFLYQKLTQNIVQKK